MTTFFIFFIVFAFVAFVSIGLSKKSNTKELVFQKPEEGVSKDEINKLLKRASEKLLLNDYKSAVAIADSVIIIQPNNYHALVVRANCLEALNYNLDSIVDYENALKIDDSDANILGLLGLTYRKIGELEKGQVYLKKSIELGLRRYQMNYQVLESASEGSKKLMRERGKNPENYLRRAPNSFFDDLAPIDRDELKISINNQIGVLKSEMMRDPNNQELRNLHNFAISQIN